MDSFVEGIKQLEWYKGQIEHVEYLPSKQQVHGSLDYRLPSSIQQFLDNRQIKLYAHQTEAINLVRDGENIVISTPTASGKSMAFNLPVFETLLRDPEARALYIYPMKALENDQLNTLKIIERETRIKVNPRIYDGDTPAREKRIIRKESRIIITNPHGLHYYLAWHHLWKNFYTNLKFIIVDESHTYRGVFGSHVALLFRRLNRICKYYGSKPQYILSSATIANPAEHSKNLTGKEFHIISEDSSGSGTKRFIFWNPPFIDDNLVRRSANQEARSLLGYCVDQGFQSLCFATSRKIAELIAVRVKDDLDKIDPELSEKVYAYRAGYLPEDRRRIERGLKQREISGVVTTNALELGIDIGSLDCVILAGYPGSIISTWQQAGRAGRGIDDSIVFLVAFQNPLDQYFMNHSRDFFKRPPENAYINLDNPYINKGHIECAANELPISITDYGIFDNLEKTLRMLSSGRTLQKNHDKWTYSGKNRPETRVKLTSISDQAVVVKHYKTILETMDITQAYREAHEGAILLHQGEPYKVTQLDLNKLEAHVEETEEGYYTTAVKTIEIFVNEIIETKNIGIKVALGKVNVSEYYNYYKILRYDKQIDQKPLNLPPLHFPTVGFWFTIPQRIVDTINEQGLDIAGAIHAIEHAMIAVAPLHAMCDQRDLGGVSTLFHRDTGETTIFIYDGYKGGIGLSEKLFNLLPQIIETTLDLIQDCQCEEGCPSCIYAANCGNNNEPLDKRGAVVLLEAVKKELFSVN
ncbi:MAG: DEAD/DEAH box helicase [Candidatus Hodarchaeales archaeon]